VVEANTLVQGGREQDYDISFGDESTLTHPFTLMNSGLISMHHAEQQPDNSCLFVLQQLSQMKYFFAEFLQDVIFLGADLLSPLQFFFAFPAQFNIRSAPVLSSRSNKSGDALCRRPQKLFEKSSSAGRWGEERNAKQASVLNGRAR